MLDFTRAEAITLKRHKQIFAFFGFDYDIEEPIP